MGEGRDEGYVPVPKKHGFRKNGQERKFSGPVTGSKGRKKQKESNSPLLSCY